MTGYQSKEKARENMSPEERVWNEWEFHSTVWHFSRKNMLPGPRGYTSIPTLTEKLILKYTEIGSRIIFFDKLANSISQHQENLDNRNLLHLDFQDFLLNDNVISNVIEHNKSDIDAIFANLLDWVQTETVESVIEVHELARHFLSKTKVFLSKCYEILREDGFFVLDIADIIADCVIPLGALLMHQALEVGFNLWDAIHYDVKVDPSPSCPFSSFDYLLILQRRKKGWKYLRLDNFLQKNHRMRGITRLHSSFRESHNCVVWNFDVGAKSRILTHGFEYHSEDRYIKSKRKIYEKTLFAGKLVPQLVRRLILDYSQPHDCLFDFFVGTGTVILEGVYCGRKSYGIDINPAAVELTRQKVQAYIMQRNETQIQPVWKVETGNAMEAVSLADESVDLVFAHPPYWGLVKYTDLSEDLSNMRLKEYLQAMQKVLSEGHRILKPEGYLVVIIGDKRKAGLVPLGSYLTLFGIDAGLTLWDLILNDTEFGGKQHDYFAQIKSKQYRFHLCDHDYLLVLRKDTANRSFTFREPWLSEILKSS